MLFSPADYLSQGSKETREIFVFYDLISNDQILAMLHPSLNKSFQCKNTFHNVTRLAKCYVIMILMSLLKHGLRLSEQFKSRLVEKAFTPLINQSVWMWVSLSVCVCVLCLC